MIRVSTTTMVVMIAVMALWWSEKWEQVDGREWEGEGRILGKSFGTWYGKWGKWGLGGYQWEVGRAHKGWVSRARCDGGSGGLDVNYLGLVVILKYKDGVVSIEGQSVGLSCFIVIDGSQEVLLIKAGVEWGLSPWLFLLTKGAYVGEDFLWSVDKKSGYETGLVVLMLD